jgi:cystinosin
MYFFFVIKNAPPFFFLKKKKMSKIENKGGKTTHVDVVDAPDDAGAMSDNQVAMVLGVLTVLVGVTLGLALPDGANGVPGRWGRFSAVIGWMYFAAWSLSFYPQLKTNWERKSVRGLSLDYQGLNIIGFLCYGVYNSLFYWDAAVQRSYAAHHDGHSNKVQINDVVFALHAFVATSVCIFQCVIYDRAGQVVSRWCKAVMAAVVALTLLYLVLAASLSASHPGGFFSWLYFLYWLSYVKVGISLIKYMPQVYMNYVRKSTEGWNVGNVILDITGGALSLAQLVIDSWVTDDWSAIVGDAAKFGLGFISIFFDIIFLVQHYYMYPRRVRDCAGGPAESLPLLVAD